MVRDYKNGQYITIINKETLEKMLKTKKPYDAKAAAKEAKTPPGSLW